MEKIQKKVAGLTLAEWKNFLVKYEKSRHVYMCRCGETFSNVFSNNFFRFEINKLVESFLSTTESLFFDTCGFSVVFSVKKMNILESQKKQIRIEFLNYIIQNFETL